jgi:hypothetical protein
MAGCATHRTEPKDRIETVLQTATRGAQTSTDTVALVGQWTIQFALDSIRRPGPEWTRVKVGPVHGTLRIDSALVGRGWQRAMMTVDFRPLLGRQMSCYAPGAQGVIVTRPDSMNWQIWFTPAAVDCGFDAWAVAHRDTLRGVWTETSFAGAIATGGFEMVRQP